MTQETSIEERLRVQSGPFKGKPQVWFTRAEVVALLTPASQDLGDQQGAAMSDENSLRWHALNYRTAHTMHAEAAWKELEAFVAAAILAERERCAKLCEREAKKQRRDWPENADVGPDYAATRCAEAIRREPQ